MKKYVVYTFVGLGELVPASTEFNFLDFYDTLKEAEYAVSTCGVMGVPFTILPIYQW